MGRVSSNAFPDGEGVTATRGRARRTARGMACALQGSVHAFQDGQDVCASIQRVRTSVTTTASVSLVSVNVMLDGKENNVIITLMSVIQISV